MTIQDKITDTRHRPHLLVGVAIAAIAATIGFVHTMDPGTQAALLVEGGPVQSLTVVVYAVCIALILVSWSPATLRSRWNIPAVLLVFIFIELDLDKSYFTVGLLKSRQYIGDQVALPERALSFVLIGLIVALVLSILIREARGFLSELRDLNPSALAALTGIALIFVSEASDGIGRKLEGLGIVLPRQMENSAYIVEEVVELGIPVMFAVAIVTSTASAIVKPD
ncbi:hypothetical protein [Pseudosulfitobacter koreensis]|uniref:Tripartite ATP-independent transporter, DctQ component n=1 Tax=Pseudosulfitobacter koreensis TaxID=2968472 RepID=A0ABT1Z4E8_9RHOB|nr:hypothetical protein [Pseudosulfitobacter koreense]MCR8828011.1 hypothetical protein [Pseudosulfitobacter koreense]